MPKRHKLVDDEFRSIFGIPHLSPRGEAAQDAFDREEMEEYLGICLNCGESLGLLGCPNCGILNDLEEP